MDSIWVLKRASRGVRDATLTVAERDVEFRELKLALRACKWNFIERTSEEGLERCEIPDYVLRVVEFMTAHTDESWPRSVGELIEAAAVKGVTTATFGKFLAQCSVFMQLCGVTLERVTCEGSKGQ